MSDSFDQVRDLLHSHPDPVEAHLLVEDAERDIFFWPGLKKGIIQRLIEKLSSNHEGTKGTKET